MVGNENKNMTCHCDMITHLSFIYSQCNRKSALKELECFLLFWMTRHDVSYWAGETRYPQLYVFTNPALLAWPERSAPEEARASVGGDSRSGWITFLISFAEQTQHNPSCSLARVWLLWTLMSFRPWLSLWMTHSTQRNSESLVQTISVSLSPPHTH